MNITEIKIRVLNSKRLKGVASITVDGNFAINDILIIRANNRLCVEFQKSGKGYELFVPLNPEARNGIEEQILCAYMKQLQQPKAEGIFYASEK